MQDPLHFQMFKIAGRQMQNGTIVPEGNGTGFPAESVGINRIRKMLEQQIKNMTTFPWRYADNLTSK